MLEIVFEKQKHVIKYQGATFTVEPNTKHEALEIVKNGTFVHKIKTGPGSKDIYEEHTNWIEVQCDNVDTQIKSWTGLKGDPPCTSENKRALAACKENDHVCVYIQEEIAKIGQAMEEKKEKKKKK